VLKQNSIFKKKLHKVSKCLIYPAVQYLALKKYIETKKDILFLKHYCRGYKKNKVTIILADYSGYPFYRDKDIMGGIIKCGIGRLFENIARFDAGLDFDIILVINLASGEDAQEKQEIYNALAERYHFIRRIIFRDNIGFDFGAYNSGYQYLRSIGYGGDVVFMNSSARGPFNNLWLLKYSYLYHKKNLGLCGVSLNSHDTNRGIEAAFFRPHVQSFFMFTSMGILTQTFNDSLPGSEIATGIQLDVIAQGEIVFSEKIIEKGFCIGSSLFDKYVYCKDSQWRVPFGDTRYSRLYNQFANKI